MTSEVASCDVRERSCDIRGDNMTYLWWVCHCRLEEHPGVRCPPVQPSEREGERERERERETERDRERETVRQRERDSQPRGEETGKPYRQQRMHSWKKTVIGDVHCEALVLLQTEQTE